MTPEMKERPILFSAPMVRAILEGMKTQTRRVVKPPPEMVTDHKTAPWSGEPAALLRLLEQNGRPCPYGKPGDRLWVRETFAVFGDLEQYVVHYKATNQNEGSGWKASIHMRREYSRILLEVVSVRVEQLEDISEADAKAEGIEEITVSLDKQTRRYRDYSGAVSWGLPAAESFRSLWGLINGAGSWDANPWVWVVEFKRITP